MKGQVNCQISSLQATLWHSSCQLSPCGGNATCVDTVTGRGCTCNAGFTGSGVVACQLVIYWGNVTIQTQDGITGYLGVLVLSQIICTTFSFVTNKYLVFKTKGGIKKEYAKFFLFHGINITLNFICLPIIILLSCSLMLFLLNPSVIAIYFIPLVCLLERKFH